MIAKTFTEILKFNPYHDSRGRFTSAGNATSFTYAPGRSRAHDNAIVRERNRIKQLGTITAKTDKVATAVVERNRITTDKRQAIKEIRQCYDKATLTGSIRYDEENQRILVKRSMAEEMKQTARNILTRQEYEDPTNSQEYHDLHQKVKNTPIKISDQDKASITDWNEYRKESFGNMTISRNGITIDSFYQELSSTFPHLFDSTMVTHPADQLQSINDTLRALKPKKYSLTGADLDQATEDMALQMLNGYTDAIQP